MIIRNGLVALPGVNELTKISIVLNKDKIVNLLSNPESEDDEIDAEGLYVLPGGIDAHVHFNTPGFEEREDFYHGSCFAASGGITTVIDMPCTSLPPVTSLENLRIKLDAVRRQSVVDYAFYGGVAGNEFADFQSGMEELSPYVMGYKCYLISGMASFGSVSYKQLGEILRAGKELRRPILLHTEEESYIRQAEERERKLGDKAENYYRSRPEEAEISAVRRAASIADETGGDLHIVHISTGEGAEIAKKYGVSVETCPHYLAFELADFIRQGSVLKVAPVIKRHEREKLWKKLRDGTISFVTSDHAASQDKDKATGSIWTDYAGIAGSGMLLPYLLSEGYFKKRIDIKRLLEIISLNPAQRYGLAGSKGRIAVGMDADFVLIDPNKKYIVRGADFLSKGSQTPFEGYEFRGKVVKTLLRGKVIYETEKGIVAKAGSGEFIVP